MIWLDRTAHVKKLDPQHIAKAFARKSSTLPFQHGSIVRHIVLIFAWGPFL